MIRHWIVSYGTSSPQLEGSETISAIPPCQCPKMTFNMSQGFKFWSYKNHQIFQIIEDIIWGQVYHLIVYYPVMVPDFEKHKSWLILNVISGYWQGGIVGIVSPPSSWGLEVSYDTIQCLITRLHFDKIAVKVNYLGKLKSTKNSKILNLLKNGFYHSNKSSADLQSNYKSKKNSKMSKSRKLVGHSPMHYFFSKPLRIYNIFR